MRLLIHLDNAMSGHELMREVYVWSFIAKSIGMPAVITDRNNGHSVRSGSWFRVRYGARGNSLREEYDLFVPKRPIREPARIKYVEGMPLVCGEEEPEYLYYGKKFGFDAAAAIFHLISGKEEYQSNNRDEFGRHREKSCFLHRYDVQARPLVDSYTGILRERIAEKVGTPPFRANWPDGKGFAVALSHDVDTVSTVNPSALRNCILMAANGKTLARKMVLSSVALRRAVLFPLTFSLAYPSWLARLERSLETICRVEERWGVRSTFFVLPPRIEPCHPLDCPYSYEEKIVFGERRVALSEVLKRIGRDGWKIGLHGSMRSHTEASILQKQKGAMEAAIDNGVESVRQHYLCFENDRTWIAQEGAGFNYDSTYGYNRLLGFRSSSCLPFRPFSLSKNHELDIWELPMNVQDSAVGKQEEENGNAYRKVVDLLSQARETGGVATLSWHTDRFAKLRYRSLADTYEHILQWAKRENAFIGPIEEVMKAWQNRSDSVEVTLELDRE